MTEISSSNAIALSRRASIIPSVIIGAVYGAVVGVLATLLLVAIWLLDQHFHPMVYVFSLVVLPVVTLGGSLLGSVIGYVVGRIRTAKGRQKDFDTHLFARLILRAIVIVATGVVIFFTGTFITSWVQYRPIARLEHLGGTFDDLTGSVSFLQGNVNDSDLPEVVEHLNDIEGWMGLSLVGTDVTGGGLRHLQQLSTQGFMLTISSSQLDDESLKHLAQLRLENLFVLGGPLSVDEQEKVKAALPNVAVVFADTAQD